LRYFRLTSSKYATHTLELLEAEGFKIQEGFTFPVFGAVKEPFALGSSLANFFGLIYLQDKASFLPPLVLNPPRGARVLDLCASPGSKTGLLALLVGSEGLVVANEPNKSRLFTLSQNLGRCNHLNVITSAYAGEKFPIKLQFQYLLLDVPCSGWGTEEKNPKVKKIWKEDRVTSLINLQKKLLARAAELLLPGGYLLYSTCTTNVQENEEQVAFAVENLDLEVKTPELDFTFAGLKEGGYPGTLAIEMLPGEQQGFFLALLQKKGEKEEIFPGSEKQNYSAFALSEVEIEARGKCFLFGENLYFVPHLALPWLKHLQFKGFKVGKVKKNNFIPFPRFRAFSAWQGERIVFTEVDKLKRLLQGEEFKYKGKGYLPFFYKDLPLGWLKIHNNRLIWQG